MRKSGSMVLIGLLVCGNPIAAAAGGGLGCHASSAAPRPLVELYTSEGCSSCPPADRWLSEFAAGADGAIAVPLVFHVDYWDYIGWKDRFADPLFARRQHRRVNARRSHVVYTPQVMLGEAIQVDWQDRRALHERLLSFSARAAVATLQLDAKPTATTSIDVSLAAEFAADSPPSKSSIYLALYSDGLASAVRAGENSGRTLRHDRVVRQLLGPWTADAQGRLARRVNLSLPAERGRGSGVVAFVEDAETGAPLQALDLPLADCGH